MVNCVVCIARITKYVYSAPFTDRIPFCPFSESWRIAPVVVVVEVCRGVECLRREADAGSGFPRVPSEGGVCIFFKKVAFRVRGGEGARHQGRCGGRAVSSHLPVTPFGGGYYREPMKYNNRCSRISGNAPFFFRGGEPHSLKTYGMTRGSRRGLHLFCSEGGSRPPALPFPRVLRSQAGREGAAMHHSTGKNPLHYASCEARQGNQGCSGRA